MERMERPTRGKKTELEAAHEERCEATHLVLRQFLI